MYMMFNKVIKYNMSFLKNNLVAHRGLHNSNIPENTLIAFDKAISKQYLIELDIHILKDNTIVVFHDYNMKRMTGINKYIENMKYEDLKKIKIENKYKIPTLKEVLNLVNGKVGIIIEVKDNNNNSIFEEKLLKELENYRGDIAIKSFNPYVIKNLNKLKCKYPTGLLLDGKASMNIFKRVYYKILKIDFISVNVKKNDKVNHSKYIVLGWTIKTKQQYDKYKDKYDNLICENIL